MPTVVFWRNWATPPAKHDLCNGMKQQSLLICPWWAYSRGKNQKKTPRIANTSASSNAYRPNQCSRWRAKWPHHFGRFWILFLSTIFPRLRVTFFALFFNFTVFRFWIKSKTLYALIFLNKGKEQPLLLSTSNYRRRHEKCQLSCAFCWQS